MVNEHNRHPPPVVTLELLAIAMAGYKPYKEATVDDLVADVLAIGGTVNGR